MTVKKKSPKKAASPVKRKASKHSATSAGSIETRIAALGDWRGELLSKLRGLIHQADPDVVEELKWRGTPTWSHDGIVCTGETYKDKVKMTFAKGAFLEDPASLFNSSLEGNVRRAIDFYRDDKVDTKALTALIRAAVELNTSKRPARR